MRKSLASIYLAIAAIVLAVALLIGCSSGNSVVRAVDAPRENVDGRFISDYGSDDFRTVVDSKTGITYLVFDDQSGNGSIGGITPLLDKDGRPVISEEVTQ